MFSEVCYKDLLCAVVENCPVIVMVHISDRAYVFMYLYNSFCSSSSDISGCTPLTVTFSTHFALRTNAIGFPLFRYVY